MSAAVMPMRSVVWAKADCGSAAYLPAAAALLLPPIRPSVDPGERFVLVHGADFPLSFRPEARSANPRESEGGHESEKSQRGHRVRQPASTQFKALRLDTKYENPHNKISRVVR